MAKLVLHNDKITDAAALLALCPFGALEVENGLVTVNAACKMCRLCVKNGPPGAVEYLEDEAPGVDKTRWRGVAVYAECTEDGGIHPVTLELVGKARQLAAKINHPVYALLMGGDAGAQAQELLHYGVDKVFLYEHEALARFRIQAYTDVFENFVQNQKPSSILVGATAVGRQLAPRVAARLRTGLTADCTILDMREDTDLVQIRPAFGGNIMAEIITPKHRPQMATVRYRVMDAPARNAAAHGEIVRCAPPAAALACPTRVLSVQPKPPEKYIDTADVLVVAGRAVKKAEDLALLEELAALLGGQLACTRPLIECGWVDAKRQIGLSGRTVRPRLIITCGVSGAIQFVAGMNGAETIVAINKDENAPIFATAHYGLVGDMYEILPTLIAGLKAQKKEAGA